MTGFKADWFLQKGVSMRYWCGVPTRLEHKEPRQETVCGDDRTKKNQSNRSSRGKKEGDEEDQDIWRYDSHYILKRKMQTRKDMSELETD